MEHLRTRGIPQLLLTIALVASSGCSSGGADAHAQGDLAVTSACADQDGGAAERGAPSPGRTFELRRAKGIPYRVAFVSPSGEDIGEQAYSHAQITFDNLSRCEWERLRDAYHGAPGLVYVPGKSYELTDFLPRMVQATVKRSFEERYFNFEEGKMVPAVISTNSSNFQFATNCWSTAYEYLSARPDGFKVYYTDRMESTLTDPRFSAPIKTVRDHEIEDVESTFRDIERDDVLIIYQASTDRLIHVAVVIDKGLFFEKTGPTTDTMYRLVTLPQLLSTYDPSQGMRYEFRRFSKLPPGEPEALFGDPGFPLEGGLLNFAAIQWVKKVRYRQDLGTGRFLMDERDTAASAFTPTPEEAAYFIEQWKLILARPMP